MLRAIRKFVFGRERDEPQEPEVAVDTHGAGDQDGNRDDAVRPAGTEFEEPSEPFQEKRDAGGSEPPSSPDDTPPVTEPAPDQPSASPVRGTVKWFNPSKHYGFVELSDGSGDAFLHVSVLSRASIAAVQPGDSLELRVAPGQRSLQVTEIISVDTSTSISPSRRNVASPDDRYPPDTGVQEMGTVKWYSATKGFGFIVRDSGGKDAFVHASVIQRAGIMKLVEGQRVFIGIIDGRKGPEAGSIELA